MLVEMLEAACDTVGEEEASATSDNGVSTRYQAPAKLIGIDETGGIIQSKFPLLKNSRLTFTSDFLTGLWGEEKEVITFVNGLHYCPPAPNSASPKGSAIIALM